MKKETKIIKMQILKRETFEAGSKDPKIAAFMKMLSINIYAFRVKAALYNAKKIPVRTFLFGDDIYNLPLGKVNDKKEILIDSDILPVFDRYMLAEEMVKKGDALTAFVVDHDDLLYATYLKNLGTEQKIDENEYIQIFSMAYNNLSDIILQHKVDTMISSPENTELLDEVTIEIAKGLAKKHYEDN